MKISSQGINLIKKWEQFSAVPYQDSAGVWTIGYGHTRTATRNMTSINQSQAVVLLKQDLMVAETSVDMHFKGLRQCQFDALTSLLFNIGYPKFTNTKTAELIRTNPDSKYIAGEWIEFRNSGGKYLRGLMRRRIDEIALYYNW